MHHLIFPNKDTFITNQNACDDSNFGLGEILRIGSYSQFSNIRVYTQTYTYPNNQYFECLLVDDFEGTITGSFIGSAAATSGSIVGTGAFSSSYFFGIVTGSISGSDSGTPVYNPSYTGSLTAFSGSVSSSAGGLDGYITSSLISSHFVTYAGYLSGSSGKITGYLSGSNTANQQGYEVVENKIINRALVKFDITAISNSISMGEISQPKFRLKMKIAKEEELPLSYKLHAFPVSQSWERGTGYYSDGGSLTGASWNYRNFYSGSSWYPTSESNYLPTADYLNNSESAARSFERGGGTWYYKDSLGNNVGCTQSFDYETSDIYMDVTPIVTAWISGSLPNEGFIVMNSTENTSGSNGMLTFFSRETNTIFSPTLDVMWNDVVWNTSSISSTRVTIDTIRPGISASVYSGSTLTIAGGIAGTFSGSVFLTTGASDSASQNISGIVIGAGLSGNIIGMPVQGGFTGSMTVSKSIVAGPCGNNFTASFASASFNTGIFSGSSFGAYFTDEFTFENAYLTGSWTQDALLGASVTIPIPSGIDPYAYAYVTGPHVSGKALGTYLTFDVTSASFNGQFIAGNLLGGVIDVQISGSVYTASYQYTSSIETEYNSLIAIDLNVPFAANIQNLRPNYVAGNVIRINVFGREEHPLKNFTRKTQLTQHLTPKYLPSSSYYSIKDNETEEIIIDFDDYTGLSCDASGNFFMLDTTAFAQERNYKLRLKVQNSGSVYVFDNNDVFKIVR